MRERNTGSPQRLYGKFLHCFLCFKAEILYLTKAVKEMVSLVTWPSSLSLDFVLISQLRPINDI